MYDKNQNIEKRMISDQKCRKMKDFKPEMSKNVQIQSESIEKRTFLDRNYRKTYHFRLKMTISI